MIEKLGIEEIYKRYSNFIDIARDEVFFGKPMNYEGPSTNFEISEIASDSILLISHDTNDTVSNCNFVGAIHLFLELGLAKGFMFRGAISRGDIIYDADRRISLSREFNKLAKFEPRMNAPMCVILDEAKEIILESLLGESALTAGVAISKSLPVVKWAVPMKSNCEMNLWCINYTYFSSQIEISAAIEYLSGDTEKQNNFINYLEYLKPLPEEILIPISQENNRTFMKIMKTRSGARVALTDDNGVIQRLNQLSFPKTFIEPPEKVKITFDPETKKIDFRAEGSWY
ncbi:hypothetical protein WG219_12735 [Ectopseudomonas mendocina]|uniref:Uncharacterized protein n=1 Tax=Ectopseudomonas mendocina TaxID=300 RepID=A0ABZ2RBQ8_ECTME